MSDPVAQSATPPPPTRRKRRAAVPLIAIVALIVGLAVWYRYDGFELQPTSEAALPPAEPPTVTTAEPVFREIVEWDEFTGQFAPVEYVELRARVSGYLQEIHFTDGQLVDKGDLLFVIDPRPFEIALAQAKAQLADATARLELANRQLARAGELRKNDFVAAATLDERTEERNSAAAAVEAAHAAIRAEELNLEFTRITAPLGGRISRHEVSIGNLVASDTTLLTTIVSLDPIHFDFDVSETEFLAYQRAIADGRLRSPRDGSFTVFAHLPDEAEWSLQGHLDFVDNQVDRSAGTIRVRAVFPNRNLLLTPGQFGRIRIPGSEPYKAIMVPDSAIVTDQSRKLLLTVAEDGTVVPKAIRPGPMFDPLGLRIVREGLEPTDRIIINGLLRARPGAKVKPEPGAIETLEQPG